MWRYLCIVSGLLLVYGAAAAQSPSPVRAPKPVVIGMTNADVVMMVKAGLGEPVVVAAIKQAPKRSFTLSADGLVKLKAAGVSDNVIRVMLDPSASIDRVAPTAASPASPAPSPVSTGSTPAPAADDPTAEHEPGIYVDVDGPTRKLVVLEPTVFSQGKTGGMFTSALTYGIKKAKWKAVVRGRAANQRLRSAQPVFYFYFEKKGSGLSNTGGFTGWLSGASSPNEFVLAKMDQKSNARELIVGEFGMWGASTGTRSQDTIDLKIERLSAGVYRVSPAVPLRAGVEYCLFYAAGSQTTLSAGGGKLFDFGIDLASASSVHLERER